MGYYSEVSITVKNDDFRVLVEKAQNESETAYEFLKEAEIFQNEKYTTLHWVWVKWNELYSEVKFVEDFIKDIPYYFHRLGESDSDWESRDNTDVSDDEDCDMTECADIIREIDVSAAGNQISLPEIKT